MPAAIPAVAAFAAANAGTIAAVSAVATVASTAYSAYSQKQQADATYDYQTQANKENAKRVAASYDDLSASEIDINQQAADEALSQDLQRREAQGRVNVFAAAAGTYGGSVDSVLFDADRTEARNINTVLDKKAAGLYSIKNQAEQARQTGIAAQNTQPIQAPSWAEIGIKTATSAVQAGSSYLSQYNSTYSKQSSKSGFKGGN